MTLCTAQKPASKILLLVMIAGYVTAAPGPAAAHPHIFVNAKFEAVADPDGNLAEVRDVWRFDEVFSSSVMLDFDKNANLKLDPAELAAVADTVRNSLAQYNYYINITMNGKTVALAKPDVFHGAYEDGSLVLSFSQKPKQKTALKGVAVFITLEVIPAPTEAISSSEFPAS
ncbi:ABC-type uncharacterized transport system, periplasmic component (plasmid) [Rhizobium favelukesii]|uniref:ABC-type uncharacterized transport system, periplasmic component n=1 Tax=Rhizobium favelukesii TaxID=348824 RepID=W6RHJ0_9HYPH|nr:DUF1007 family protein [Rhizobium favelukesii]CDM59855.1 ABC-type uncharacterized transport system, periplasmic component [Rhizobium favelukesii]CDM59856.1 ABC-type uncharacterized transport system, periplasmic component [Rhizobium favelukesii]